MECKFSKNERLHSKKLIKELFDKGSSFFLYPFKVLYLDELGISDNQLLVSVSKKKLKNATDRNYIKRRVKEAYRLNKHLLPSTQGSKKLIALIYVSNDLMGYHDISPKVIKVLRKVPVAKPPQE
ncbi:ribonuclease P protein component [Cyclobacterium qasimii]|uniref:Ribonuclease P protein component n=1 Tax=Cyclobacterium qasimii TaxID=1350429 RepID=A0A512CIH5_9BACT|nr:ribonuclease P protein component [Cyclobacterium qasimii]GEO24012.1 ribonuclease P protein component [Cyclobacterium qasimii]